MRMPAHLVLVASLVQARFGAEPWFGEYAFVSSICGAKIVVIVKSGLEALLICGWRRFPMAEP